ncbi:uncharacterized protein [Brachionichthys hirsutus]|uniref:uncharacterized protein n=1 Tax=Brachionichthys hirsutus TaxID=412623 RepID=UPI003604B710
MPVISSVVGAADTDLLISNSSHLSVSHEETGETSRNDVRIEPQFQTQGTNNTSEKPHAGSVCNKSYKPRGNLKVHMGIHTEKMVNACPFCKKVLCAMSQHLIVTHNVQNPQERRLLVRLSSLSVDVRREACPIEGCGLESARLDRHLKSHTELSADEQSILLQGIRRAVILSRLKSLRASYPAIPMESTFDMEDDDDRDRQLEAACQHKERGCQSCVRMREEEVRITNRLHAAQQQGRKQLKRIQLQARELKRMRLALGFPHTPLIANMRPVEEEEEEEEEAVED